MDPNTVSDQPTPSPGPEPQLTQCERDLRDKFVTEYLIDYDSYKAAIRIGYSPVFAREYHQQFMGESYVLRKIKAVESKPPEEYDELAERRKIVAGLWREANYMGAGGSQAARVAALAKLSAFYGMDAPTRSQAELTGKDGQPLGQGVLVVPGLISAEDWAVQAAKQQEDLVRPDPSVPPQLKLASNG